MLKITNGINVFEVTRGAYEDIYSLQGYKECDEKGNPIVDSNEEVKTDQVDETETKEDTNKKDGQDDETETDKCIELLEKPIAQWNKDEIKFFASEKGIDISGTKNAGEAKERIKAFLDENQE